MTLPRPVTEDDLHAYVDNALDPGRRANVEIWLAGNPEAARRVAAFADHRAMLRAALSPAADEDVPSRLSLQTLIATRRAPSWHLWRSAAAVLLLVIGGSIGWFGRGLVAPPVSSGIAAIAQEAMISFNVYGSDPARPVEIKAADRAVLLKWLSKRLGRPIAAPDLSAAGYQFLGGRLVATPHGPAGLFMYDDVHGARLVMLVRPMAQEQNAQMVEHNTGDVAGFTWSHDGLGYSLVGAAPPGVLHPLADEIQRQTGHAT